MSETKPLTWTVEDETKIRKWSAAYGDSEHYVGRTLIELDAERKAHEQTREQLADHERGFELRWAADVRAISRWRESHPGNELAMPDHADLCVCLLEKLYETREIARELKEALGESLKAVIWVSGPSHSLALQISDLLAKYQALFQEERQ